MCSVSQTEDKRDKRLDYSVYLTNQIKQNPRMELSASSGRTLLTQVRLNAIRARNDLFEVRSGWMAGRRKEEQTGNKGGEDRKYSCTGT